ncbi:MAG: prepilin peptidase [Candidatus Omnitrophica bacterium]|nr:prepilin peptidase [Candidatus Omnitrophota bacterium]
MDISAAVESLAGPWFLPAAVFVFGLLIGSFLNVCIWRLPAEEQVVRGRSHCRSCGAQIAWYDNIPLVSFAALKGRCRHCGTRISWLYPAVELATALLLLAVFCRFGWTAKGFIYGILTAAMVVLTVIDAREMILPDEITIPGLIIGLILSFLVPSLHGQTGFLAGGLQGIYGVAAGGGLLWIVGTVGSWIFKKEAMGGGDVKMMAMVGAFIGWEKVLLVNFILAPVVGAVVGIVLKLRFKKELIPYGPFLSLGTLAAIFYGNQLIDWYIGLFF